MGSGSLRSRLPSLHGSLWSGWQPHRMFLYVDAAVQGSSKRHGRVLLQQPHLRGTTTRTGSCRRDSPRARSEIKKDQALIISNISPRPQRGKILLPSPGAYPGPVDPAAVDRPDHGDCGGCSIFFRISSQTDLTSAVITDACSMRSKISFASSRYFCAVSWT